MQAESFAVALRRFRQERGLSLRELARLANYGKSYLLDLEHGRRCPHAAVAARLDSVLEADGQLVSSADRGNEDRSAGAQALRVAVAVVCKDSHVLVVRRREQIHGMSWQFPAGVVKPEAQAADVAVKETLAETDILCAVTKALGSRVHPLTGVVCDYFLCDYLSGEASNRDPLENSAVIWVDRAKLPAVIPVESIFGAVREALGGL